MKPADQIARSITDAYGGNWTIGDEAEICIQQDIIDAITQARREGAEDMRERAAAIAGRLSVVDNSMPELEEIGYAAGSSLAATVIERSIRALPLEGNEQTTK